MVENNEQIELDVYQQVVRYWCLSLAFRFGYIDLDLNKQVYMTPEDKRAALNNHLARFIWCPSVLNRLLNLEPLIQDGKVKNNIEDNVEEKVI